MSGELVRSALDGGDLPMCPMSMGPGTNATHAAETSLQNRLYDAMKDFRGEEDEYPDPVMDKLYQEVVYSKAYSTMQLHVESTRFLWRNRPRMVESWYYRCHLCGFVLPAQLRPMDGEW